MDDNAPSPPEHHRKPISPTLMPDKAEWEAKTFTATSCPNCHLPQSHVVSRGSKEGMGLSTPPRNLNVLNVLYERRWGGEPERPSTWKQQYGIPALSCASTVLEEKAANRENFSSI